MQLNYALLLVTCLTIFSYVYGLDSIDCNLTCSSSHVLDAAKCMCVPKLNCSTQPMDTDHKCHLSKCDTQEECDSCPDKCYCKEPSVLNKYCPVCLNGGIRNYSINSCTCRCFNGYQGTRCQYIKDPCTVEDQPYCSTLNCYNATEEDFFRCQRKCLCCKNKTCYHFGTVKNDCTCECMKSKTGQMIFDAASDCQNVLQAACVDSSKCYSQFKVFQRNTSNCKYDFIKALCPKTCNAC